MHERGARQAGPGRLSHPNPRSCARPRIFARTFLLRSPHRRRVGKFGKFEPKARDAVSVNSGRRETDSRYYLVPSRQAPKMLPYKQEPRATVKTAARAQENLALRRSAAEKIVNVNVCLCVDSISNTRTQIPRSSGLTPRESAAHLSSIPAVEQCCTHAYVFGVLTLRT